MGMSYNRSDKASQRAAPERTTVRIPGGPAGREPLRAPGDLDRLTPAAFSALQRSVGNRGLRRALERQHTRPAGTGPSRPFDNAVTRTIGSPVVVLRSSESPPQKPNEPVLEPYKGQSVNKLGQVSAPASQYSIARTGGVNVRARPDGTIPHIAKVIYGTELQVQAFDNTGGFYFIIAKTGAVGWVNKDLVALDPPDIGARLHHITESNLTMILKKEYVDKNLWTLGTGNDYTTLAAAVVAANAGRKGVFVDWDAADKYKEDHPMKRWLDPWMIDNFAIYHGSTILAGHNIWLPSPAYVRMLQSSGVIGSRPGWINAAVDVGKGITGFLAGVVSGVFGSIWDTLTGLWELAEGIVSAVRGVLDGSLFAAIEDIYDTVTGMTLEQVKALVTAIITMGQNAFDDFQKKWEHPDTYQQWHFKGYIVGAVALEVVLAIFTGGATLAAKVLAKIGKYFPKLMRVLNGLLDLAKKRPGRRYRDYGGDGGRDKGDRDDEDMSSADRAWEQARVLAAIATEEHDRRDTPVETLIPILNTTIAPRFRGVSSYQAIPLGVPNTYKIIQRVRRSDVDDRYTGKAAKAANSDGDKAGGDKGGLEFMMSKHANTGLRMLAKTNGDWSKLTGKQARAVGVFLHKMMEGLVGRLASAGWERVVRKAITPAMVAEWRRTGKRLVVLESHIPKGGRKPRLDLAEIDFAKGQINVIDYVPTSDAAHLSKTRAYGDELSKLTGLPASAVDVEYVKAGQLAEELPLP